MFQDWLRGLRKYLMGTCAALLMATGVGRAQDKGQDQDAQLRALIQEQGRQIQELKAKLEAGASAGAAGKDDKAKIDDNAVKKIVAGYLRDNPGAGMPSSVQAGYKWGQGFSIASSPDPKYSNWDDDCKIPFELRFRGRFQLDYYNYKVTDRVNHITGALAGQNSNAPNRQADFSQLEIKRLRLIWEGSAFDPNLRYNITLDGNTRGLGGVQNNKVIQTGGATDPNTSAVSPIGGGVTVDHAVRLFEGWVAYDFRPCWFYKGCGPDCDHCGEYKYAPTITLIAGKMKPFFCIEEVLGSGNEQLVEYSMADWFFDADDDNLLMGAGCRVKALDDRFYMQAIVTNGNESQFPNVQMDNLPGFNIGFWYDLGGRWDCENKRWELFGDCLSDIDYSCCPVLRVGGAADIVPLGRRSLYGDDEQSRIFVTPAGPQGGTRLINVLNGDGTLPGGAHAVDDLDYYTLDAFAAFKYKGFSFWNEWYLRDLNNFRTTPNGQNNITYTVPVAAPALTTTGAKTTATTFLFPHHALLDYGSTFQGGYFIVPKKWEIVARYSFIRGESGDIYGTGKPLPPVVIPTVDATGKATTVAVPRLDGAFRQFHEAHEIGIGVNYYFKRQLLKWQTDLSYYAGGNPAGGGQSPAGFIAGSDGWLLRTQIQLWF
jgi:hypothetical protein